MKFDIREFVLTHKKYFFIFALYFVLHLIYLTKLPTFNDESIYLDWADKSMRIPGFLFYSLLDGKQPLMIWIWGIAQSLIPAPLWITRFTSVIMGSLTLLGVMFLTKTHHPKATYLSGILYTFTPIFVFFNRQTLMESSLATVTIWLVYFTLIFIKKPTLLKATIIGILAAIGFWIKSSILIPSLAILLVITPQVIKWIKNKNWNNLYKVFYIFFTSQLILIPLYAQNVFWQTQGMNNQFAFGIHELIKFPFTAWISNMFATIDILIWQVGAVVTVALLFSFIQKTKRGLLWHYQLVALTLIIIITKNLSPRYLVIILPSLIALTSNQIHTWLHSKKKIIRTVTLAGLIIIPLQSLLLVFAPQTYLKSLRKVSSQSQYETYVTGWTAGYASREARYYLKTQLDSSKKNSLAVRQDAGNPESFIFYSFAKEKINVFYFEELSQVIEGDVTQYDCIYTQHPFYYISRGNHLSGTPTVWREVKRFYNPDSTNFVAIYTPKENCTGETIDFDNIVDKYFRPL